MSRLYCNTRCVDGRLFRHDPQWDDPHLETDIGVCPDCEGFSCDEINSEPATQEDREQEGEQ